MADRFPTAPPDAGAAPAASLAEFVRRHDPDRFLCALFAPAGWRDALFALLAYNHELARAREAARTPMVALMRLQWWRDAVEEAAAGKPPRRHEVAAPLARAIGDALLDPADLLAMADARETEAEDDDDALPTVPPSTPTCAARPGASRSRPAACSARRRMRCRGCSGAAPPTAPRACCAPSRPWRGKAAACCPPTRSPRTG
jgi:hypothetical protein